ncbi:hypothetical protein [Microbulbifer yueqingensis]|uniref:Uncharacterized protein n=1 Tax=Microbulbifer yueqingensis TaxID=658219 RepID=A0A1G8VN33_9GAMM|nr:hypothetical protein [Microbulbifer yueqingensis]SDJ67349.1 hypothetical protein SAMN05216212_0645 [Microbulbifer yueqingensis]
MRTTAALVIALLALPCLPGIAADKASASGQLRITLRLPAAVVPSQAGEAGAPPRLCFVRVPAQHYSLEVVRAGEASARREIGKYVDGCIAVVTGSEPTVVTVIAE